MASKHSSDTDSDHFEETLSTPDYRDKIDPDSPKYDPQAIVKLVEHSHHTRRQQRLNPKKLEIGLTPKPRKSKKELITDPTIQTKMAEQKRRWEAIRDLRKNKIQEKTKELKKLLESDQITKEEKLTQIKTIKSTMTEYKRLFESSQEQLLEHVDLDQMNQFTEEGDETIMQVVECVSMIDSWLDDYKQQEKYKHQTKLPQMSITEFNGEGEGKFMNFILWFNQYSALVANRQDLTPTHKVHYLVNSLKGTAYETVKGLVSTNDHELCMDSLKARFGKKELVLEEITIQLNQLPKIDSVRNIIELRKMYDTVNTSISTIQNYGEDVTSFSANMIMIAVLQKIPQLWSREWELQPSYVKSDLRLFIDFLQQRVTAQEAVTNREQLRKKQEIPKDKTGKNTKTTTMAMDTKNVQRNEKGAQGETQSSIKTRSQSSQGNKNKRNFQYTCIFCEG